MLGLLIAPIEHRKNIDCPSADALLFATSADKIAQKVRLNGEDIYH